MPEIELSFLKNLWLLKSLGRINLDLIYEPITITIPKTIEQNGQTITLYSNSQTKIKLQSLVNKQLITKESVNKLNNAYKFDDRVKVYDSNNNEIDASWFYFNIDLTTNRNLEISENSASFVVPAYHGIDKTFQYYTLHQLEEELGILVNHSQNRAMTSLFDKYNRENGAIKHDELGSVVQDVTEFLDICAAEYLAIIIDNEDNYYALVGETEKGTTYINDSYDDSINPIKWYQPKTPIILSQFKDLDLWIHFSNLNELIYFILTKYESDIIKIDSTNIDANEYNTLWSGGTGDWNVHEQVTTKEKENTKSQSLWCYINPMTMTPYSDDYWFNQGEHYFIKNLTLAKKNNHLQGHKIVIKKDKFPGMYMLVGETFIRNNTGNDDHLQLRIPLCKIKSNQEITLQSDGEPTVFSLDVEVACPKNGIMMEINTYETAPKMIQENQHFYLLDGSDIIKSK